MDLEVPEKSKKLQYKEEIMKAMYFIFYKIEKDFVNEAIDSIHEKVSKICIINNSGDVVDFGDTRKERLEIITPEYPLTFSQTFNLARKIAINNGMDVLFTQHSDAKFINVEDSLNFINYVIPFNKFSKAELKGKWGQVLTNHDIVTAYNVEMLKDVGEMDTVFPQYFADCDYLRRMSLNGWEIVQSDFGDKVLHMGGGSTTMKNDKHLKMTQNYTFPLYEQYYVSKWGGSLGKEKYLVPFNKEVGNENS